MARRKKKKKRGWFKKKRNILFDPLTLASIGTIASSGVLAANIIKNKSGRGGPTLDINKFLSERRKQMAQMPNLSPRDDQSIMKAMGMGHSSQNRTRIPSHAPKSKASRAGRKARNNIQSIRKLRKSQGVRKRVLDKGQGLVSQSGKALTKNQRRELRRLGWRHKKNKFLLGTSRENRRAAADILKTLGRFSIYNRYRQIYF